jgi:hypothetical protein
MDDVERHDDDNPITEAVRDLEQAIIDRLVKDGNAAHAFELSMSGQVLIDMQQIADDMGPKPRD